MRIDILKKIGKDESGATAIEYGLIAALVSVAAISALTAMGGSLKTMFGPGRRPFNGSRWLNGITSVYPRVPPLDGMSSLRAGFPGGG